MNDRLKEIKARLEEATPGPWRWEMDRHTALRGPNHQDVFHTYGYERMGDRGDSGLTIDEEDPDAILIANAPTDIAWLVQRVEELEKDRKRLRDNFNIMQEEHAKARMMGRAIYELFPIPREEPTDDA